MAEEPWICGNCRSINKPAVERCYSCHSPKVLAVDPRTAALRPTSRVPDSASADAQAAVARSAGSRFQSSALRAAAAQIAVVLVTAVSLAKVAVVVAIATGHPEEPSTVSDAEFLAVRVVRLSQFGAWLIGSAVWGFWLMRVVGNIPALGGGWPRATPRSAFLSSIVPVYSLYSMTATLREAIQRLSAPGNVRLGLITAWWLALTAAVILEFPIGPTVLARVVISAVATAVFEALFAATGQAFDTLAAADLVEGALLVVAALLAVALIGSVEGLQRRRLAELGDRAHDLPSAAALGVTTIPIPPAEPRSPLAAAPALAPASEGSSAAAATLASRSITALGGRRAHDSIRETDDVHPPSPGETLDAGGGGSERQQGPG